MDDVTFRRLAPDAIAGRLDAETQAAWREAAAATPERAALAVQIAQAEVRAAAAPVPAPEASRRVPKQTVVVLGAVFALVGMLAGGMVMSSYLKAQRPPDNEPLKVTIHQPVAPEPEPDPQPDPPPAPDEPTPEPQAMPEPELPPVPIPVPQLQGLVLRHAEGAVFVQQRDGPWAQVTPPVSIPEGMFVLAHEGHTRFEDKGLALSGHGRFSFEVQPERLLLVEGRHFVRCRRPQVVAMRHLEVEAARADFSIRHLYRREIEIKLLAGTVLVRDGRDEYSFTGPCRIRTADMYTVPLADDELAELRQELTGVRRVLLRWDCETPASSPEIGEVANGTARRRPGALSIGSAPGRMLFEAPPDGRLSLRVLTFYTQLHLSMRVHFDDGYRVVDMLIDLPGTDGWHTIDVPLADLRAGRGREEPGWYPGRRYSALTISAAVKPGQAYERRELVIDDVEVYSHE